VHDARGFAPDSMRRHALAQVSTPLACHPIHTHRTTRCARASPESGCGVAFFFVRPFLPPALVCSVLLLGGAPGGASRRCAAARATAQRPPSRGEPRAGGRIVWRFERRTNKGRGGGLPETLLPFLTHLPVRAARKVITVMFDRDSEASAAGPVARPFASAASAEAWWHGNKGWLLSPSPV
jgi:hypothetical protein